jgi:hypothetical protein
MRGSVDNFDTIELVLSKRNLLALLHKLEMVGSARTIIFGDRGWTFVIKSESNEEHYRDRIPGAMHPQTEAFIEENSDV